MQQAEFLSAEEVGRIHASSLEILENVGMLVRNNKARDIYARHGCRMDSGTRVEIGCPPDHAGHINIAIAIYCNSPRIV